MDDARLDVADGEVHALLGENGAGKSTIVKVLSGLVKPNTGSVLIFGRSLARFEPKFANQLGVRTAFQEISLVKDLTVAQAAFLAGLIQAPAAYDPKQHYDLAQAALQGACVAGGFMVANMCDLMVAADDAFFSDPVVHSLAAASVEALLHPWVLGMRKAKEFLYTGQRLSAQEAKEWGMVNHVVARAELEDFTLKLAQQIALAPPMGLRLMKRSLNRSYDMMGFRNSLMAHFDTHILSTETAEHHALRSAGMEASMDTAKKARHG